MDFDLEQLNQMVIPRVFDDELQLIPDAELLSDVAKLP